MSNLLAILALRPARSIEDVIAIMTKIDETLARADGVSCFNKLYLTVTAHVLAACKAGTFASPEFLVGLDVAFANLYFDALAAHEEERDADVPRAWRPLFAVRGRSDIAPIQFALAGMNAHINRDLPVGIIETCTTLHLAIERPSPQYADYERVNDILEAVEVQVKNLYAEGFTGKLITEFDGVDDVIAMWGVRDARAAAWTNAEALWNLRQHSTMAEMYFDTLDGMVGFASRGLLIPTAL